MAHTYKIMPNGYVYRDEASIIPNDPANADYAAYLEWLAEGNTPEPWPPAES